MGRTQDVESPLLRRAVLGRVVIQKTKRSPVARLVPALPCVGYMCQNGSAWCVALFVLVLGNITEGHHVWGHVESVDMQLSGLQNKLHGGNQLSGLPVQLGFEGRTSEDSKSAWLERR